MSLLEVTGMSHSFGGLKAVSNYHLRLNAGDITGLIGPNGAGKTTIFNLITGIFRPDQGDIRLNGVSIVGRKPHQIAGLGIGRTFQEMRLWRHMSVLDHVRMARYSKLTYGLGGAFWGGKQRREEEEAATAAAMAYLAMFGVEELAHEQAFHLPYGAQRRVEMARAMAMEPRVLLLDEPTVGMTEEELGEMVSVIRQAHGQFHLAIFLIEHRLRVVRELCTRVQALVFGEVLMEGSPDEVQNDPKVIEAYIGDEEAGF
jgi:branched-chain amino acid transport system ATP-binding protein